MKVHIFKRTFTAFCIALSVLTGLAFRANVNSQRLIDLGQMVPHTNEVLYLSDRFLSALVSIETSERGYTITGDSAFPDSYVNSIQTIQKQNDHLLTVRSNSGDVFPKCCINEVTIFHFTLPQMNPWRKA